MNLDGVFSAVTSGHSQVASVPFIDLSIPRSGSGIIWVNSSHENRKYIREAERSAKTMRTFVDNAEYVLVSDGVQESLDRVFDFQSEAPFHVPACLKDKVHFNGQMIAKHSVLKHMTWEKNLYLGSDIAALRPEAAGLFNLLDNFDIVAAHAPGRFDKGRETDEKLLGLPECFPEMNCDLIAYRRSKAVGEFLSEWQRVYSTNAIDHPHDQGAFRYLIFKSELRLYVVPPEYNYRGYDAPSHTIISQRREVIPQYAKTYRHIAEIYESYYCIEGDYWPSPTTFNWMGKRAIIHNHGSRPVLLILSGQWRPADEPVDITLVDGPNTSVYRITQSDNKTVIIPPNVTVVLTASSTFVPDRVIHNGDQRALSVLISLEQKQDVSDRPK